MGSSPGQSRVRKPYVVSKVSRRRPRMHAHTSRSSFESRTADYHGVAYISAAQANCARSPPPPPAGRGMILTLASACFQAREPWRKEEHERFLEALDKFGRNWKQIVDFVGTRSVQQVLALGPVIYWQTGSVQQQVWRQTVLAGFAQIRSHAQKFFLKLEKEGQQEDIPPPRPKKRPARPYPHKQQTSSGAKSKRPRPAAEDTSELKRSSSGGSSNAGAGQLRLSAARQSVISTSATVLHPTCACLPGTRSKLTKLDEEELAAGLGLLTDEVKPDPAAALPMTTRAARRVTPPRPPITSSCARVLTSTVADSHCRASDS